MKTVRSKENLYIPGTEVVYGSAGCPVTYSWCEDTPAMNVFVYMVAFTLMQGLAAPLSMISLSSLVSKILGPIKQVNFLSREIF